MQCLETDSRCQGSSWPRTHITRIATYGYRLCYTSKRTLKLLFATALTQPNRKKSTAFGHFCWETSHKLRRCHGRGQKNQGAYK